MAAAAVGRAPGEGREAPLPALSLPSSRLPRPGISARNARTPPLSQRRGSGFSCPPLPSLPGAAALAGLPRGPPAWRERLARWAGLRSEEAPGFQAGFQVFWVFYWRFPPSGRGTEEPPPSPSHPARLRGAGAPVGAAGPDPENLAFWGATVVLSTNNYLFLPRGFFYFYRPASFWGFFLPHFLHRDLLRSNGTCDWLEIAFFKWKTRSNNKF